MWKVITASVFDLEAHLNDLEAEGFQVFSVLPVGAPEFLSNVPREHKSLEQRTTFAVVAHKAFASDSQEELRDAVRAG
jgi:hypothetical protein